MLNTNTIEKLISIFSVYDAGSIDKDTGRFNHPLTSIDTYMHVLIKLSELVDPEHKYPYSSSVCTDNVNMNARVGIYMDENIKYTLITNVLKVEFNYLYPLLISRSSDDVKFSHPIKEILPMLIEFRKYIKQLYTEIRLNDIKAEFGSDIHRIVLEPIYENIIQSVKVFINITYGRIAHQHEYTENRLYCNTRNCDIVLPMVSNIISNLKYVLGKSMIYYDTDTAHIDMNNTTMEQVTKAFDSVLIPYEIKEIPSILILAKKNIIEMDFIPPKGMRINRFNVRVNV